MFVLPISDNLLTNISARFALSLIKCHCFMFNFHQHCATKLLLLVSFFFHVQLRMYNSKLQSVEKVLGTPDLRRTLQPVTYYSEKKCLYVLETRKMEVPLPPPPPPPPPKKKQCCNRPGTNCNGSATLFWGEGEMSNIYNKKWKNNLSVPMLLPLIVVVASTGL